MSDKKKTEEKPVEIAIIDERTIRDKIYEVRGVKGGRSYLPYAFTEQGVYLLMTVLRGDLAVKQSRALVMAFKAMKDYIVGTQGLVAQRDSVPADK